MPAPGPPPPPPAPPPVNSKVLQNGETEEKHISVDKFVEEVKQWRRTLEDLGHPETSVLVVATPLKKVFLQNGPMCGLVALAEALLILNETKLESDSRICPKLLLEEAIKREYSKQGEMFSVEDMKSLAEFGGATAGNIIQQDDTSVLSEELTQHLIHGSPILIPYDADFNHTPALRKGHAAHWAVIHGFSCIVPYSFISNILNELNASESESSPFDVLYTVPDLTIIQPNRKASSQHLLSSSELTPSYLIAHQGKSYHTAVWKHTDLLISNRNLTEISPKILADQDNFVMGAGIQAGLQSKILLLK